MTNDILFEKETKFNYGLFSIIYNKTKDDWYAVSYQEDSYEDYLYIELPIPEEGLSLFGLYTLSDEEFKELQLLI